MKKTLKLVSLILVVAIFATMLFSCSNATEDYAAKINEAAKAKESYTYAQVLDDLGDEAIDITVGKGGYESGIIIAVKGVTSEEDLKAKVDAGEKIDGIVITMALGKATGAVFKTITSDLFK